MEEVQQDDSFVVLVTVHWVAVPRRCWSDGCRFGRRVNSNLCWATVHGPQDHK